MNILSALRDKIGSEEIKLLSGFLGENEENLAKSTDLSITSILQGLLRHMEQGPGVTDIMNVIRDGGHSGDILDDLKGLFKNQDKTQLLVTIGNNINSHFFEKTSSALSDKVAEFGGIKKTSAASLFSLCSPLVLGVIGKQVKSVRMSQADLSHLLQDQKDIVQSQLPPAINTVYDQKQILVQNQLEAENEKLEVETEEKDRVEIDKTHYHRNAFGIFAWLLLAGLVLAAAYYSLRNRAGVNLPTLNSNVEMGSTNADSVLVKEGESGTNTAIQNPMTTSESKESQQGVIDPATSTFPQEASAPTATVPTNNVEPRTAEIEKVTSTKSYPNVVEQLGSSNSWASMSGSNFIGNSAEVKASGELRSLATFLKKNTNKTLQISGIGKSRSQEDRAYAIQGKLYELGVPLSQLEIVAGQTSTDGSVKMKIQ